MRTRTETRTMAPCLVFWFLLTHNAQNECRVLTRFKQAGTDLTTTRGRKWRSGKKRTRQDRGRSGNLRVLGRGGAGQKLGSGQSGRKRVETPSALQSCLLCPRRHLRRPSPQPKIKTWFVGAGCASRTRWADALGTGPCPHQDDQARLARTHREVVRASSRSSETGSN